MKSITIFLSLLLVSCFTNCTRNPEVSEQELTIETTYSKVDLDHYPSTIISNETVKMKIYLPDPEKGVYRATRFDWSGVIGSVKYQEHEYFGYWKDTHDPNVHEDLTGPVEGFLEPGLGYDDAEPGEGFIRIGVGIIEKMDEPEYQMFKTYNIMDHGDWQVEHGSDWITFTHQVNSDFGYGYLYEKSVSLKDDGFTIGHKLVNTGDKSIETDQFNHNFFMIDGEVSGPSFTIDFPYQISTADDLKGMMDIEGRQLSFLTNFKDTSLFLTLEGYSDLATDHQVTVVNNKSGAGVTFNVDKPLHRMCFWACETTLSPENFIWISVVPGEEMKWTSDYTLFVES
jgi:hypothetical protein